MSRYNYSDSEKEINIVLKYQSDEIKSVDMLDSNKIDEAIKDSEDLLSSMGYSLKGLSPVSTVEDGSDIIVPSWEDLLVTAQQSVDGDVVLEDLFTEGEIIENALAIKTINDDYKNLCKLDKYDYILAATAGIIGGLAEVLLVGVPHSALGGGEEHKPLSDFVRKRFEEVFPPGALESSKLAKVPFDAQDNRHTTIDVKGLSAYYHRLLELGHDPFLGFFVGVLDIMNGNMTTVDKAGRFVIQSMGNYDNRIERNVFSAILKELVHLKSDVTTSMGLPVPLMGLFNLLQFGSIGDEDKMIAEVVQEMYHEGYDFIHFCSMSIPSMLVEVVVRAGYTIRKIRDKDKSSDIRDKHIEKGIARSRLNTMLFIAHSAASAINAGKVCFKGSPLAINYPEWMNFAKYAYKNLKAEIIDKPELANAYVTGIITEELNVVYNATNRMINELALDHTIVFN